MHVRKIQSFVLDKKEGQKSPLLNYTEIKQACICEFNKLLPKIDIQHPNGKVETSEILENFIVNSHEGREKLKLALIECGVTLEKEKIWDTLIGDLIKESRGQVSFSLFERTVKRGLDIVRRIENAESVLPNFDKFCAGIQEIYEECKSIKQGKKATYIPQLAYTDENLWGVAVETVDGRTYSVGDCDVDFSLQSCSKPLIYSLAVEELGTEYVSNHMGYEPSGARFNSFSLTDDDKPFNPFVNSGAIMTCSLILQNKDIADVFTKIQDFIQRLAGGSKIGFNNCVFLSERATADRNRAIAYFLNEHKAFPPKTNLDLTLDLYFQTCSLEANVKQMATIAATLANGGICPRTGRRVLSNETVRDTLILLFSCGMYDYSGAWAFCVGLPAKSGVSGCIMVVIPNVMGFATFSPLLDVKGNSVKGVEFCKLLTRRFNFHLFTQLVGTDFEANTRAKEKGQEKWIRMNIDKFMKAAEEGDLDKLHAMRNEMTSVNVVDKISRTPLHVACSYARLEVVKFLVEEGADLNARDKVGNTPLDEAIRADAEHVIEYLVEKKAPTTIPIPNKEKRLPQLKKNNL